MRSEALRVLPRIDRHLLALSAAAAAGLGVVGTAEQAEANIVHSGPVNINIPSSTAGVYLNVVTGVSGTAAGTPGWDVNPWNSTGLGFFNPAAPAGGVYVVTAPGFAANLTPGTPIDGASLYGAGTSSNFAQWNLSSSNNLLGFRFQNEANGNQIHYGWARLSLQSTIAGQPRAIVEYAYEDVAGAAIGAGVVPEPASLGLLALGAIGLMRRRSA